jgi:hypothetical protein
MLIYLFYNLDMSGIVTRLAQVFETNLETLMGMNASQYKECITKGAVEH